MTRNARRPMLEAWAIQRQVVWVPSLGWIPEFEAFSVRYQYSCYKKARKLREHWEHRKIHPSWQTFWTLQNAECKRLENVHPFFKSFYDAREQDRGF